ncbi:hypothetical protein ROZALSC1DRAFT_16806, partial [Rozella allomycis CSF55]
MLRDIKSKLDDIDVTTSILTQTRNKDEKKHASTEVLLEKNLMLSDPPCFSGDKKATKDFWRHCQLMFKMKPQSFNSDEKKIAYCISRMTGVAFSWFSPYLDDLRGSE